MLSYLTINKLVPVTIFQRMSIASFKQYNFFIGDSSEQLNQQAQDLSRMHRIPFVHIGVQPNSKLAHQSGPWSNTRQIQNLETLHVAIERNKDIEVPLQRYYGTLCLRKAQLELLFCKLIDLEFKGLLLVSSAEQCEALYSMITSAWFKQGRFSTLICCSSVEDEYSYVRPLAQKFPNDVRYLSWERQSANRQWLHRLDDSYIQYALQLRGPKQAEEWIKQRPMIRTSLLKKMASFFH